MEIHNRWRFADVVIDLNELVALVGEKVYLRDGREIGVGVAAADALRKAIPSYPEPQPGTRDKGKDSRLSRSPMNFRNSAWHGKPSAVADGAMPGVSPQRPNRAPKPGCEGQGLTNAKEQPR